jgi:hypothetical protein
MNDAQDAIEALQAKVGIDTSGETTSIDYLIKNTGVVDPGHKHSSASITSVTEAVIIRPGTPLLSRNAEDESISGSWTFTSAPTFGARGIFTAEQGGTPAPGSPGHLHVGAGGGTPNAATFAWGDNTGWKLRLGTQVASSFSSRFAFLDTGELGIGTDVPHGLLQFTGSTNKRKIVLYEAADNDHQFAGIGTENASMNFQASSSGVSSSWKWSHARTSSLSHETMRLEPGAYLSLARDNDVFIEDLSSGYAMLNIYANDIVNAARFLYMGGDSAGPTVIFQRSINGDSSSFAPPDPDDTVGTIAFQGQVDNGAENMINSIRLDVVAEQTFTSTNRPSYMKFSFASANVAGGPQEKFRFSSDGDILVGRTARVLESEYSGVDMSVLSITGGRKTDIIDSGGALELSTKHYGDPGNYTLIGGVYFAYDGNVNTSKQDLAFIKTWRSTIGDGTASNEWGGDFGIGVRPAGGDAVKYPFYATGNNADGRVYASLGDPTTGPGHGDQFNSGLSAKMYGSFGWDYITLAGNYAASGADRVCFAVYTGGIGSTFTLPPSSDPPSLGKVYVVVNRSGGVIDIVPGTGNTLELYAATVVHPAVQPQGNGITNWFMYVGGNVWKLISGL